LASESRPRDIFYNFDHYYSFCSAQDSVYCIQTHTMTSLQSDFGSHFGIENIPFGIASSNKHTSQQAVTRVENKVIFLADLVQSVSELQSLPNGIFSQPTLNAFAALGRPAHKLVRSAIQNLIKENKLPESSTEDISACQMHLPVQVSDFTDFSCSEYHNLNAGHAATGRRGLPPSWGFIPPGRPAHFYTSMPHTYKE
jgi:fumarylacetoacetase